MRRILLNTLALTAVLAGGLTFASASQARGTYLQEADGPKCGVCTCDAGQKCRKLIGGCECY